MSADPVEAAGLPPTRTARTEKPRTEITRIREKGRDDRADLDALLDSAVIGHVGLVDQNGLPVVIPTAAVRDRDRVLMHGSTGSGWMRRVAAGAPICLTVTAFDGLVVARSAFESSIHYRSAVLFGVAAPVPPDERVAALDLVTEALVPGRVAELRRHTAAELAATIIIALPITEWSLKVSDKWPEDPPEDVAGTAWAGVVPRVISYGPPRTAPDLGPGIPVPDSVTRLTR